MKKINIVRKNEEFNDIISSKKNISNKYYKIFYRENNLNFPRFGVTVSKKNANAVNRNKNKRQIKDIIDKKEFKRALDCIIIIKKEALGLKYLEKKNELESLIQILEGDFYEKK